MRVLVCIKRVPAPGARINVTPDGQAVDTAHLGFAISPHEECAVEEAVQIVERTGGTATVLTVGPADAEEQLRYAASLGVEEAALVVTDGADWDPQRTAAAVLEAIRALEARHGSFDLILFGNESADSGGYQVGIRVAHALERPMVNAIKGIEIAGESATVRRPTDTGTEIYQVPLPAVLGVKEGINLPRYPTLKGRLNSKKVQIETIESSAAPGGQRMVRLLRPAEQVSETVILGTGAAAASAVVDLLEEIGVA
jgi:electron transfer flavoprotein beta subunit